MPYNSKIMPQNNVHTLGFSDHAWELLAKGRAASKFFIPVSLQPLNFEDGTFVDLTRKKVSALVALIQSYYPETLIEFLITDTLFLNNHAQSADAARIQMQARKIEWARVLGLPVQDLTSNNTSFMATYTPHEKFEGIISSQSLEIKLSSWEEYYSTQLKDFMSRIREVFNHILSTEVSPEKTLLNDELLFSEDKLGFVKKTLEHIITHHIGYTSVTTDLYREFMGTFSLTAINHLKKLHKIGTALCRANPDNAQRTASKTEVFMHTPEASRLQEYIASFCHLIEEFYYTANILIMLPRQNNVSDSNLIWMFYASGIPNAPSYHPIDQLTKFIKAVNPNCRGFSSCAEFPLKPKSSTDLEKNERYTSSNGEQTMINTQKQTPPQAVNSLNQDPHLGQAHNGSPSVSASSGQNDKNASNSTHTSDYSSGGEDKAASVKSSKSSIDGNDEVKDDNKVGTTETPEEEGMVFASDPVQTDNQSNPQISEIDKTDLFRRYLTLAARNSVLLPDAQARIEAAITMMVLTQDLPTPVLEVQAPIAQPKVVTPTSTATSATLLTNAPSANKPKTLSQGSTSGSAQVIKQTKRLGTE